MSYSRKNLEFDPTKNIHCEICNKLYSVCSSYIYGKSNICRTCAEDLLKNKFDCPICEREIYFEKENQSVSNPMHTIERSALIEKCASCGKTVCKHCIAIAKDKMGFLKKDQDGNYVYHCFTCVNKKPFPYKKITFKPGMRDDLYSIYNETGYNSDRYDFDDFGAIIIVEYSRVGFEYTLTGKSKHVANKHYYKANIPSVGWVKFQSHFLYTFLNYIATFIGIKPWQMLYSANQ